MSTRIFIPSPLRSYTGDRAEVTVGAGNVSGALEALVGAHPSLRSHLFDERGRLRSFVNIYLNDDDIRYLSDERTTLTERDVISIIPAIAGGAS